MHLASTTGVPVSTTTCPVLGDTCLVSVPGRPIADVVNLQVNVGLHTAVLVSCSFIKLNMLDGDKICQTF